MISHLIVASSFGIIPILYKSLLLIDIDSITILIITKLIISVFCVSLLMYGDNYKTVVKDIKEKLIIHQKLKKICLMNHKNYNKYKKWCDD